LSLSLPLTLTPISVTRTRLYHDEFGHGVVQSVEFEEEEEEEEEEVTTYVMFSSKVVIEVRLASLTLYASQLSRNPHSQSSMCAAADFGCPRASEPAQP